MSHKKRLRELTDSAALRPDERFRLLMAALGRDDQERCNELMDAAPKLHLRCADHAPYVAALANHAMYAMLELCEEAARYREALSRAVDAPEEDFAEYWEVAQAARYVLKVKAAGWQRFCASWKLAPYFLWRDLPGYRRLKATLDEVQKGDLHPETLLEWLNENRPEGEPEITEVPLTVESAAAEQELLFQHRVKLCQAR